MVILYVQYYLEFGSKYENKDLEDYPTARMTWNLSTDCTIKDLRDRENWKYTYNYCKKEPGKYAVGDINGKQNTINISVEGNYNSGIERDMKTCVAKYAPKGIKAGD